MTTTTQPTLCLIGVGLIGGSLALDLKHQRLIGHVIGIDPDRANLERALERGVIDQAAPTIHPDLIAQADLIVIATPVGILPDICRQLAPHIQAPTLICDVGSTKQSALAAFHTHLPHHLPHCLASHPIAGSDRHGAAAAQFALFRGKKWIICPHATQNPQALTTLNHLLTHIGAQVIHMDAAEHDRIYAAVSHLPHLLAFAYMHQIAQSPDKDQWLHFAASGFRDFTRIAASPPSVWADIAMANRHDLLQLLQQQQQHLAQLQQHLQTADRDQLTQFFHTAATARRNWQE